MTGTATGSPEPLPFPWDDVMGLGLGVLRLAPAHFWAMTPRELDAALRGLFGRPATAPSPPRATLETLMRRFPDQARDRPGPAALPNVTLPHESLTS